MEPMSTDRAIADRIIAELAADPQVGKIPIEVIADRGMVPLEGAVSSEELRQRVESIARRAAGGAALVSEIEVRVHDRLKGTVPIVPPRQIE